MAPMRVLMLCLLALASACANHRYFAPREHRDGHGPDRHPAAVYALQGEGAHGEVRIWSAGSARAAGGGEGGSEVHLGFELENTGRLPLQLDLGAVRCDELRAGDEVRGPLRATRVTGNPEVAPGTTGRVDAWFEPGPGIAPRRIESFVAQFVVRSGEVELCQQRVPFVPWAPDYSRYDDPWRRGGFGFGVGFGFGWYGHSRLHCH